MKPCNITLFKMILYDSSIIQFSSDTDSNTDIFIQNFSKTITKYFIFKCYYKT